MGRLIFRISLILLCSTAAVWASDPVLDLEHWPYELEGCGNTRDQLLAASSARQVGFEQERRVPCHVRSGYWHDAFTGELIRQADEVIVTTVVPLSHVRSKGGNDWTYQRWQAFARDRDFLIILKRGGAGETAYKRNYSSLREIPESPQQRCEFAGMWLEAKQRWGVSLPKRELNELEPIAAACASEYARDFFRHWSRFNGSRCDARIEVLKMHSQAPVRQEDNSDDCSKVVTGRWNDPYTGRRMSAAADLDIDHMVPLKHAYQTGAWGWSVARKEAYANYLTDMNHLLPVDYGENRSKNDKHPGEYMPPNEEFGCRYLELWLAVKFRWGLGLMAAEAEAMTGLIQDYCDDATDKRRLDRLVELVRAAKGH